MRPVPMTPERLAEVLREMATLVEQLDSFEGQLTYEPDAFTGRIFQVTAMYRTGNSMGQGGWRMHGHPESATPTATSDTHACGGTWRPTYPSSLIDRCDRCGEERA